MVPTDKPVVPLPTIKQVRVYSLSLVSSRSLSDRLTDMQEEDVEVQTSQDTSTQKSKTIGGQITSLYPVRVSYRDSRRILTLTLS
jgi:hypothetical protein